MQNEFRAFVSDEISYSTVYAWTERQGFPTAAVQQGGPESAIHYLEGNTAPRLLLIDSDGVDEAPSLVAKLVAQCGPMTKIVACGIQNDVGLYRQFIAAGATDYFVKPLTHEQLTQAMALVLRGDTIAGTKDAKIVVFIGVRGGVGTTTLAVNTAWCLANEKKKHTALVDLDLQFGNTALSLDLEAGRGLRDLVSSPQRVDGLMISSSLVSVNDRLSVLSAEEGVDDFIPMDGNAITALMKEMRPNYNMIIVDLPRHVLSGQKRLLMMAHDIVLVTDLSLVGIRDTLRLRSAIKSLGCPARGTIVASRVGTQRPPQVDGAVFSKGAQARIDFIFPEDCKTVNLASNTGKSFVDVGGSTPLTKVLRDFAEYLEGPDAGEAKSGGGLFSRLLGALKPVAQEDVESGAGL